MRHVIFTIFYLISFCSFSQTIKERNTIANTYNSFKTDSLIAELKAINENKERLIDDYIKQNLDVPKSYYGLDNKFYEIIDIINNKPIYRSNDNSLSAIAIKTNSLHPGGTLGLNLEGEGMIAGVWDSGHAFRNHDEFMNGASSRVSFPDTPNPNPSSTFHATHVLGTVGAKGVNSSAKGMAPKATLYSFNWTNDETEVGIQAAQGLLVSNHSYGVPIYNDEGNQNVPGWWYMGAYSTDAHNWDNILHAFPSYLMVASAGNSGTDNYPGGLAAGYDKLTGNKVSKNNLVVANANPTVNSLTGTVSMIFINTGSSQGPSDDGRIKPDIAADGTQVYSTSNASTTSYASATGTSMAAPAVSGTLLLLQEYYRSFQDEEIGDYMLAATLKGLVCHTAMDDIQRAGPDPFYGWGMLDAKFAAETILKSNNNQAIINENVLNDGDEHVYTVNITDLETLKATICWTDPAGTPINNVLNSPQAALVNDLDLRIFDSEGNEFFPWKLQASNVQALAIKGDNLVDNVERVDVAAPSSGNYTIVVNHKGVLEGGSQAYSLIVTGSDLTLSTNSVALENEISIWPNPATDILNISFKNIIDKTTIALYDIQGREVYVQSLSQFSPNQQTINTSGFSSGMYLLKINSGSQTLNKKVIIE